MWTTKNCLRLLLHQQMLNKSQEFQRYMSGLALTPIEKPFDSEVDSNEVIDSSSLVDKMKPRRKRSRY